MFERSGGKRLGVLGGHFRTIGVVQHLRGRRPGQSPAEEARVGRHDDEIESSGPGKVSDLRSRILCHQNSLGLTGREFGGEEGIEFPSRKVLLLFRYVGNRPHLELKRIMAVEIEYVKQTHASPEHAAALFT